MNRVEGGIGSAGSTASRYADDLRRRHESLARAPGPAADAEALRDDLLRRGDLGAAPGGETRDALAGHLAFDLTTARLHQGPASAAAARALKADAFTIGRDVFFGEGRLDPSSRAGRGLLAHELTHVGQQTGMGGAEARVARRERGEEFMPHAVETAPRRGADGAQPGGLRHQDEGPARPAMVFALPPAHATLEGGPEPSQSATEEGGGKAAGETEAAAPSSEQADPRAVADRVYELMMQEVILGRQRGAAPRRK